MSADDIEVQRDEAGQRFVASVDGESLAHMSYRQRGDRLDLVHTEVDPRARGRGIGEALVRQVLDELRASGERVIASCPFVTSFIAEHPDYRDLVAE